MLLPQSSPTSYAEKPEALVQCGSAAQETCDAELQQLLLGCSLLSSTADIER
jgi:hypothetical protein